MPLIFIAVCARKKNTNTKHFCEVIVSFSCLAQDAICVVQEPYASGNLLLGGTVGVTLMVTSYHKRALL